MGDDRRTPHPVTPVRPVDPALPAHPDVPVRVHGALSACLRPLPVSFRMSPEECP
ncbi:hypothetical protein ABZ079_19775 [Streptomyces sp. NPDC006314]|uniref:hypothetical protein n=1 Tax=Streptomyces sp. NPDC006314 TaxID=3154475 RepID=UPI0033AFC2CC